MNRLLETHRTENEISEADIDILRFAQPIDTMPLQLFDAFWMEILEVPHVTASMSSNGHLTSDHQRRSTPAWHTLKKSQGCPNAEAGVRRDLPIDNKSSLD